MKKWKKIKSERVFDHKYFRINKDLVELPSGKQIEWLYWDSNESAMVVARTKDNQLVMIRQYRYLPDCEVIEFPSGKVEGKEKVEEGASREFSEETGYTCEKLIKLGAFYETYGQLDRKIHIFYGDNTEKMESPRNPDKFEDIKVELVPLNRAVELALDNKIIAMGSSLAVLLTKEHLKK